MPRFLARLLDRWLGERIIVHGAGPNGSDLKARIVARPNETTVVLKNGATITSVPRPSADVREAMMGDIVIRDNVVRSTSVGITLTGRQRLVFTGNIVHGICDCCGLFVALPCAACRSCPR